MSDLSLLVARLKTAGAKNVYEVNAVKPPSTTASYIVLGLDTGTPVNRRTGGPASFKMRRLTAQCFGIDWSAVTDMADYADAAFEDATLTELAGTPYSTRELQFGPTRDPDTGGVLYILHTYRF